MGWDEMGGVGCGGVGFTLPYLTYPSVVVRWEWMGPNGSGWDGMRSSTEYMRHLAWPTTYFLTVAPEFQEQSGKARPGQKPGQMLFYLQGGRFGMHGRQQIVPKFCAARETCATGCRHVSVMSHQLHIKPLFEMLEVFQRAFSRRFCG